MGWIIRGSNLGKEKMFASSSKRLDRLWSPPPPVQWVPCLYLLGLKAHQPQDSGAEVNNEWSYTSTSPNSSFIVYIGIALYIYIYMCVCVCVCVYVCMYACMHACVYVGLYMSVYVCI